MTILCTHATDSIAQMHVLGSKDSIYRQIVSSSIGSLVTILSLNPLNVIKIHLQKQTTDAKFSVSSFYKAHGIRGFWAGCSSGLVMSIPNTVMYMVCYEQMKALINRNNVNNQLQSFAPAIAGISARAVAVTIISPMELIRTLQTGSINSNQTIGSLFTTIVQQNGIRGLYKGWWPTILRDCPFSGVYWLSFEYLKPKYTKFMEANDPSSRVNPSIPTFLAGATSGSVSAFITHPFDVLKTNQQLAVSTSNSNSSFSRIWESGGIRGLFRGLTLRLFTVIPSSGIMITVYELIKSFDM